MNELRLDGNAAAGPLREVFAFEATTAEYACGGCGKTGALGGTMVYEVKEMGTIIRCPGCNNVLIRLAHNRGRYTVDLRGTTYLTCRQSASS